MHLSQGCAVFCVRVPCGKITDSYVGVLEMHLNILTVSLISPLHLLFLSIYIVVFFRKQLGAFFKCIRWDLLS